MDRRTRTLVVMSLSIVLALLASYAVLRAVQQRPAGEPRLVTRQVIVAREALPVGTRVTADHLRPVAWPASAPIEGAFAAPEEIIGRGLIASVVANEPVTAAKLAPREAGAGLPPTIPPGMRAVAVKVNDVIGVAGFTVPGSRVDVVVTMRSGDRDSASRVVVSNVQVLAAGTKYDQDKARDGKPMPTTVVTLLVQPADAERIALAQNEGQIVLALRNPLDVELSPTSGVRASTLMSGAVGTGTPVPPARPRSVAARPAQVVPPAPPAPAPYIVEAIRGAKRTQEVVQ